MRKITKFSLLATIAVVALFSVSVSANAQQVQVKEGCPSGMICYKIAPQVTGCPHGYICRPVGSSDSTYNSTDQTSSGSSSANPTMGDYPSGTCYTISNNLQIGATGPDVESLQLFLISKGYTINDQGTFGVSTQTAVKSYQRSIGLAGTGYVGPLTRASINGSCTNSQTLPPVSTTPTSLTVISPINGEKVALGESLNVIWNSPTPTQPVDISVLDSSGRVVLNQPNVTPYSVTSQSIGFSTNVGNGVPPLALGQYSAKVCFSGTTNCAVSPGSLTLIPAVTGVSPSISYVSPQPVSVGSTLTVYVGHAGRQGNIILQTQDGSKSWSDGYATDITNLNGFAQYDGTKMSFTVPSTIGRGVNPGMWNEPTIPLADGSYNLYIGALDANNNFVKSNVATVQVGNGTQTTNPNPTYNTNCPYGTASDGVSCMDYATKRQIVQTLYERLQCREPDAQGWDYWMNSSNDRNTLTEAMKNGSVEYPTKQQIIQVYQQVLGRAPSCAIPTNGTSELQNAYALAYNQTTGQFDLDRVRQSLGGGSTVVGTYPGFSISFSKTSYVVGESVVATVGRVDGSSVQYPVDVYVYGSDSSLKIKISTQSIGQSSQISIPSSQISSVYTSPGQYTLLLCDSGKVCNGGYNTNAAIFNIGSSGTTQSTITVLSPNGGQVLTENSKVVDSLSSVDSANQIFEIKWTGAPDSFTDIYGNGQSPARIAAYLDQNINGQWNTIGRIIPMGYGSIMWIVGEVSDTNCLQNNYNTTLYPNHCLNSIRLVNPGNYYVRIVDTQTGAMDRSDSPFTINSSSNTAQPSITVMSPNGGEVWQIGKTYTISWTSTNVSRVSLDLYNPNTGTLLVKNLINITGNPGSVSWTIPSNIQPGQYWLRVGTCLDPNVYCNTSGSTDPVSMNGVYDGSNQPFTITNDNATQPFALTAAVAPGFTNVGTVNISGNVVNVSAVDDLSIPTIAISWPATVTNGGAQCSWGGTIAGDTNSLGRGAFNFDASTKYYHTSNYIPNDFGSGTLFLKCGDQTSNTLQINVRQPLSGANTQSSAVWNAFNSEPVCPTGYVCTAQQ